MIVDEPLFKSYVFVKVGEDDRTNVRMTDGVVNFVYWNGKPSIIKDKEIVAIQRFLDEYHDVEVVKLDLVPQQRVKVIAGPLMDQEGKVLEINKKTAKVCLDSLGFMLVAYIEKKRLRSILPNQTE